MNLWFRLAAYLAAYLALARRRHPLDPVGGVSELWFRVWPTDLDLFGHVNNARYLSFMDFGRLDIMLRTGLLRVVRRHGWMPVVATLSIRFRREMRLGQRFRLLTRIAAWQEEDVLIEHRIVLESGRHKGQTAAIAVSKAGIYDRNGRAFVAIARLMDELGVQAEAPAMTPELEAMLAAGEALRSLAQQELPPA